MKRLFLCLTLGTMTLAPGAFADIADYMINVNGVTYCPGGTPEGSPGSPGLCNHQTGLAGAGATGNLDTAFGGVIPGTGLGTETLVFNPGVAGNYFVNMWLYENVNINNPFDQYGSVSGTGPAAGQTWQIDVPDASYMGELGTAGAGTIVKNTAANTLSDTNFVPGKISNSDLSSCGFFGGGAANPNCNDGASMALGEAFSLAANQEEILTFTVQQTAPAGGFYLATTDPTTGTTDYFFATATPQTVGGGGNVPEPNSWVMLFAVAGILGLMRRRRVAAQ